MLPASLTRLLVDHALPNDVTQSYVTDWTIGQLREPARKVAGRIERFAVGQHDLRHSAAPLHLQHDRPVAKTQRR